MTARCVWKLSGAADRAARYDPAKPRAAYVYASRLGGCGSAHQGGCAWPNHVITRPRFTSAYVARIR